jgi:hypothetical protein
MDRITGATVEPDLHGAGKDGFREGSPGASPATIVTQEWLNDVQEEICTVIERGGISLAFNTHDQLYRGIVEASGLRAAGVAIASHVSRSAPTAVNYRKIAYGEGVFVAANDGASSPHTSSDGVTWTNRSITALNDVCYGSASSRFLGVGPAAALVTSENGTSYTARTPAGGYSDTFYCCATNGTVYVAAGENGEIQSSSGGTSGWTHRTADSSFAGTWFGATYGNGVFVLVGFSAPDVIEIQTSTDGTTWNSQVSSETNGGVYDVAYGGGVFVVVGLASGAGPSLIMRSVDNGVTWENVDAPNDHATGYAAVAYDGTHQLFVAVGVTGGIAISRDGSQGSWRDLSRASFTPTLNGVAFGDGTCVIAGNSSALRQSLAFPWRE